MSENKRIFVGRVREHMDLESYFSRFGKLNRVDRKPTFAFVEFVDAASARAALQASARPIINGEMVAVSEAHQRVVRADKSNIAQKFADGFVKCICGAKLKNDARNLRRHKKGPQHTTFVAKENAQIEAKLAKLLKSNVNPASITELDDAVTAYYNGVRPSARDVNSRNRCQQQLLHIANSIWKDAQILMFGSVASGLFLRDSDIDFCLAFPEAMWQQMEADVLREEQSGNAVIQQNNNGRQRNNRRRDDDNDEDEDDNEEEDDDEDDDDDDDEDEEDPSYVEADRLKRAVSLLVLKRFYNVLRKRRSDGRFMFINRARVPIIQRLTGGGQLGPFKFDITAQRFVGVQNSALIRAYAEADARFKLLALTVKAWGAETGVVNSSAGFVSSYCIYLMLIFVLQTLPEPVLPKLQADTSKYHVVGGYNCYFDHKSTFKSRNKASVGELLLQFFRFYAHEFDWKKDAVSIRRAEPVLKSHLTAELVCVLRKNPKTPALFRRKTSLVDSWEGEPLAVEDPFETNFNPGRLLDFDTRGIVISEMRKAYCLLRETPATFFEQYCNK